MPFPFGFSLFPRRHAARALVRLVGALLGGVASAQPVAAQAPTPTMVSWADLEAAPGASPAQLAWLRGNIAPTERDELAALVGALSAPAAAQLMASYLHADGSVLVPFTHARAWADSLAQRPPDGDAGRVHVAYLAARLRTATIAGWETLGVFAPAFRDASLGNAPPGGARSRGKPASDVRLRLRFDLAPAESLLAIVGTPDIAPTAIMARLDAPAFAAMLRHRSQSFFQLPWTRELMALNLARAASTMPVDRLYAYANPKGFLDFGDVRRQLPRYRTLLDALRAAERPLLGDVEDSLAPYLPAGTTLDRTVSVYFGDGADGWASGSVAAIDLEWFKDDWARLRTLIAHEAFHAAQAAVRRPTTVSAGADSVLHEAIAQLFTEGTATYVAPTRPTGAAELSETARAGAALLDSIVTIRATGGDLVRARALVDRGVAGAGPFYLLGRAMAAAIVDAFGAGALAATLRDGELAFVRRYRDAAARRGDRPLLSAPVFAAVDRLRP